MTLALVLERLHMEGSLLFSSGRQFVFCFPHQLLPGGLLDDSD